MTYKNKELQRKTTAERVKRYRAKQKVSQVCPRCNGRGIIEVDSKGFLTRTCPECKGAKVSHNIPQEKADNAGIR